MDDGRILYTGGSRYVDVLMTGWGRRDRVNCEVGTTQIAGTRRNGTSFLLDPDRATVV